MGPGRQAALSRPLASCGTLLLRPAFPAAIADILAALADALARPPVRRAAMHAAAIVAAPAVRAVPEAFCHCHGADGPYTALIAPPRDTREKPLAMFQAELVRSIAESNPTAHSRSRRKPKRPRRGSSTHSNSPCGARDRIQVCPVHWFSSIVAPTCRARPGPGGARSPPPVPSGSSRRARRRRAPSGPPRRRLCRPVRPEPPAGSPRRPRGPACPKIEPWMRICFAPSDICASFNSAAVVQRTPRHQRVLVRRQP